MKIENQLDRLDAEAFRDCITRVMAGLRPSGNLSRDEIRREPEAGPSTAPAARLSKRAAGEEEPAEPTPPRRAPRGAA